VQQHSLVSICNIYLLWHNVELFFWGKPQNSAAIRGMATVLAARVRVVHSVAAANREER
jgi:hypothetical protein